MEKTEIISFLSKRKFKKINAFTFKREKDDCCSVVRFSEGFVNVTLEKWTNRGHISYSSKTEWLTMTVLNNYTSFRDVKKRVIKKKKELPSRLEMLSSVLLMNGLNPLMA